MPKIPIRKPDEIKPLKIPEINENPLKEIPPETRTKPLPEIGKPLEEGQRTKDQRTKDQISKMRKH